MFPPFLVVMIAMRFLVPSLLCILLSAALACSSSGSGTIRKDASGDVSGYWTFVVDDDGYVTRVWVNFKPSSLLFVAPDGSAFLDGARAGFLTASSASLDLGAGPVRYVVSRRGDSLLLVPAEPETPSLVLVRAGGE